MDEVMPRKNGKTETLTEIALADMRKWSDADVRRWLDIPDTDEVNQLMDHWRTVAEKTEGDILRVSACIRACDGVPTEELTDGLLRVLVNLLGRLAEDARNWMADANGLPPEQFCPPCSGISNPCPICEAHALLVRLQPSPAAPSELVDTDQE